MKKNDFIMKLDYILNLLSCTYVKNYFILNTALICWFFNIFYHVFTKFQIQTTFVLDMSIFSPITQATRISNTHNVSMSFFVTTSWVWIKCFCSSPGDSWMVYTQQDHLRYIPSTRKWYLEYTLLFTSNFKPTTSPRNKLEINGLLSRVLRSLLLLNKPKWLVSYP
jgi:hypothetical protein